MKRFTQISRAALIGVITVVMGVSQTLAQDPPPEAENRSTSEPAVLVQSLMCEGIEKYKPVTPAVVFPISLGKVFCFTAFDPVHEETVVYHRWFRRDHLISNARLVLNPPNWSSFSSMQLRSADKGPWRVEVVDSRKKVMTTLRFSISD